MRRLLLPLIVTVVLAALVLAALDLRPGELGAAVGERLMGFSLGYLGLAFGTYGLTYVGRGVRLYILVPEARGLLHLAGISARHNLFNMVLPFRSGELALPWMLKQEAGHSAAEGAAALLVARVLDLLCVATYLSAGLALAGDAGTAPELATQVGLILAGLVVVLLLLRPVSARLATALAKDGERGLPGLLRRLLGRRLGDPLVDFGARSAGHLAALRRRRLTAATVTSLFTWGLTYLTIYLLLQGMAGPDPVGVALEEVDFAHSLIGSTGLHLTTVFPVNTVGSVGVWEAGWTAGYLIAGLDKDAAGISAVVSHLVVFGFIVVIGGLGFLLRRRPGGGDRGHLDNQRPA